MSEPITEDYITVYILGRHEAFKVKINLPDFHKIDETAIHHIETYYNVQIKTATGPQIVRCTQVMLKANDENVRACIGTPFHGGERKILDYESLLDEIKSEERRAKQSTGLIQGLMPLCHHKAALHFLIQKSFGFWYQKEISPDEAIDSFFKTTAGNLMVKMNGRLTTGARLNNRVICNSLARRTGAHF